MLEGGGGLKSYLDKIHLNSTYRSMVLPLGAGSENPKKLAKKTTKRGKMRSHSRQTDIGVVKPPKNSQIKMRFTETTTSGCHNYLYTMSTMCTTCHIARLFFCQHAAFTRVRSQGLIYICKSMFFSFLFRFIKSHKPPINLHLQHRL